MVEADTPPRLRPSTWLDLERIGLILAVAGMIFSAGMNWHRLDAIDERMSAGERLDVTRMDLLERDYVRKDVIALQLNNITAQLEEIKASLHKPSAYERTFDK